MPKRKFVFNTNNKLWRICRVVLIALLHCTLVLHRIITQEINVNKKLELREVVYYAIYRSNVVFL